MPSPISNTCDCARDGMRLSGAINNSIFCGVLVLALCCEVSGLFWKGITCEGLVVRRVYSPN